MKYCIFDVETTGLKSTDEVVQFCCMIFEDTLLNNTKFIDFYCMSTIQMSDEVIAVHNLSVDKLYELSGQKFFEEQFDSIKKYLEGDVVFIGYNVSFDIKMVNESLKNANLSGYDFGQRITAMNVKKGRYNFDVMPLASRLLKGSNRKYKQAEILRSIPEFNENEFNALYRNYIKKVEASNPSLKYDQDSGFHNARYDVFALWYITTYLCPELVDAE